MTQVERCDAGEQVGGQGQVADATLGAGAAWRRELERHYRQMTRQGGVTARCYLWLPDDLAGLTVLDIGCRNGKGLLKVGDHVGADGQVWGLEWDPVQAGAARALVGQDDAQDTSPVRGAGGMPADCEARFRVFSGYPEDLEGAGIGGGTVDAVVVNSVFNLVFSVPEVLRSIWRALRPGGLLCCDTVVAARAASGAERRRACMQADPYGAAPTRQGLQTMMSEAGFAQVKLIDSSAEHAADRPSCADEGPRAWGCRNVVVCARKP